MPKESDRQKNTQREIRAFLEGLSDFIIAEDEEELDGFDDPFVTAEQKQRDSQITKLLTAYEHDRIIPDPIRVAVLERDGFKCTCCGWSRDKLNRDDPRKMLELHHKQQHKDGGENTVENLITLCNVCHDAIHRQKE